MLYTTELQPFLLPSTPLARVVARVSFTVANPSVQVKTWVQGNKQLRVARENSAKDCFGEGRGHKSSLPIIRASPADDSMVEF